MTELEKSLSKLVEKRERRKYSDVAIIKQTYTKVDCTALGIPYTPERHITCDVELVQDRGNVLYNVRLTPVILKRDEKGVVTDVVADGSPESPTGTVKVQIPQIGSYVFISYTDDQNAFVAVQSNIDTITLGTTNGGYFNFYTKENKSVVELVNTQSFAVRFPNGRYLELSSDLINNTYSMSMLFDYIEFLTKNNGIICDNEKVEIFVKGDNKIDIHNDNFHFGSDILNKLLDSLTTFINDSLVEYNTGTAPNPLYIQNVNSMLNKIQTIKTNSKWII